MSEIERRAPEARELTAEEQADQVSVAFKADQAIKGTLTRTRTDMWELAARFYDFDENKRWRWLGGYETLTDWLAEPEIGVARSTFYALRNAWDQLVVRRGLSVDEIRELEWTKVKLMLPAVTENKIDVQTMVADARALGWADIREKYTSPRKPKDEPIEGKAKEATVDSPGSEPVRASEVEPQASHDQNGEPRYGHFDEPPAAEPVGLADVPTYTQAEYERGLKAAIDRALAAHEDGAPDENVEDWDWVRCPSCSALHRASDLIPAEPDEVNAG